MSQTPSQTPLYMFGVNPRYQTTAAWYLCMGDMSHAEIREWFDFLAKHGAG